MSDNGDPEERIAACDAVLEALADKGDVLSELDRLSGAIDCFADVVARVGEVGEPELRAQVVRALVEQGYALAELDRAKEAQGAYDAVIAREGECDEPEVREWVMRAM